MHIGDDNKIVVYLKQSTSELTILMDLLIL